MTATKTAPAAGVRAPLTLIGTGTLAMVAVEALNPQYDLVSETPLVVWTAGILVAALFPADPPGHWRRPSLPELVHGDAAFLAFAALPTAAVLLRRRFVARRPGLRTVLNALTTASITVTAALAVFLADVMDDGPSWGLGGAPTLVGLIERLVLAADFGWVALALVAVGSRGEQERDRRA